MFNADGDLILHDSDMESDVGLPWYRPTQLFHVPAGADLGWRSGWAKFPSWFVDGIPGIADTGRGSPTGAALYQHFQYPMAYQNSLFLADWSEGRILNVQMHPAGGSYQTETSIFLTGRPGNIVDLDVGEDGCLYFCTGGRGTAGGVFRVVWKGQIPKQMFTYRNDLERVIRHPQPTAAWARQNLALLKQRMGDDWKPSIIGVVREKRNTVDYRIRGLDLMVLFGPTPSPALLDELSTDPSARIRGKVAQLCGLIAHSDTAVILNRLLTDSDTTVRRRSCEAWLQRGESPSLEALWTNLPSTDRAESTVARRLLERIPVEQWRDAILKSEDQRVFIQGAIALLTVEPSTENSVAVLNRTSQWFRAFISDANFIDLLRVVQLALQDDSIQADTIPEFTHQLVQEFPAGLGTIDRELAVILARLNVGQAEGRIVEFLASDQFSEQDKLDVALHWQTVGKGLSGEVRLAFLDRLEKAAAQYTGGGYRLYLDRAIADLAATLTDEQIPLVLERGAEWPNTMIPILYRLPQPADDFTVQKLVKIDQQLRETENLAVRRLRLGIIAMLAGNGSDPAMDYLRQIWRERPSYRSDIAIGLAQRPDEKNWAYLVSSLPHLDDRSAQEVLTVLRQVRRRPKQSQQYRDVIELGWRIRQEGADAAAQLLEHWTRVHPETDGATRYTTWEEKILFWKDWFQQRWPDQPVSLPSPIQVNQYDTTQILDYLDTHTQADPQRGQAVFIKSNCVACHNVRGFGQAVGPELTHLDRRFSKREILESIVSPSKVIPDRFRSRKILTTSGQTHVGMTIQEADGSWLVLDRDGNTVRIQQDEVEAMTDAQVSAMPEGLLNHLTLDEIADLFAFLTQSDMRQADHDSSPAR